MSDAFPFLGNSSNGRSPSFDASRTVNLFLEPSESGTSRSGGMLIGTPGLYTWATLAGGGVRASIAFTTEIAVVIIGTNVYKIGTDGTATLIGNVDNSRPVVSLASNGSLIMMVGGPFGYFIDPVAATVTMITDPDFLPGDRVDFINGYFIWNDSDTGKFQITQLYGTDIDGLDFAVAEGSPDNIITLIVDHNEAWLLGSDSAEVWIGSGNVDFPFERIQGAFLEIGCAAPYSVAKADNSIFWLSTDARGFGTVQRAVGYAPARVSNHAVEFAIAQYMKAGTIADAVAYTYSQEGHTFYVLTFPSANGGLGATWALDLSITDPKLGWHERAWRNPSTAELGRHRSNSQMNFAGKTIVGDWETGLLYVMDLDTYTDNGDLIEAIRVCPHMTDDGLNVRFTKLELFMQTGVGLPSGQGSDPQAMLQWSDDGGYTWSSEVWRTIGMIGKRQTRVRWTRLGIARDRLFKVSITDPVKRVFTGAAVSVIPCTS